MTDDIQEIVVNGVPIRWNHTTGSCTFFGIETVLFWQRPSLFSILEPLIDTLGEGLYAALIAHNASQGTYED